jgi:tetratricopeptide (TPR) repeat protein
MVNEWQERQLEVGRSLVQQGSQALRQGDFNTANSALNEANAILDMAEEQTDELLKLRAQILNETGFILQQSGNTDEAIANHDEAVELCEELMDHGVDFRANAAATNINLAGLLAGSGDFERAREVNDRAIELAESLLSDGVDLEHSSNLAFGAHQNLAMILARNEQWDDAQDEMRRSMELLDTVARNNPNVNAQAAQGCQQMSVLMFNEERYDDALEWGREAEELSEKAYQAIGEQALPIYVTSQINLISYYEKASEFADAEDCLFKALDVVGNNPQILARGKAFYEQCRKQADNRLEAGNLPRQEVEEGYEEILERIEEIGGIDEVLAQAEEARKQQQQARG